MPPQITISELLQRAQADLSELSPTARLDAELLFSYITGCTRSQIISRRDDPLEDDVLEAFYGALNRRKAREPIAYITGEREFYSLFFEVAPTVLIPRPETELLVEKVVQIAGQRRDPRILDLGTGSGCIAVAIAVNLKARGKSFSVTAVDKSAPALKIARRNAARHLVESHIEFLESDWFEQISPECRFDIIVSNPPYVSADEDLESELCYEPEEALFAGSDGMDAIRSIITELPRRLAPGGRSFIEIGFGQRGAVEALAAARPIFRAGCSCSFHKDLAGIDRVVELSYPNSSPEI